MILGIGRHLGRRMPSGYHESTLEAYTIQNSHIKGNSILTYSKPTASSLATTSLARASALTIWLAKALIGVLICLPMNNDLDATLDNILIKTIILYIYIY